MSVSIMILYILYTNALCVQALIQRYHSILDTPYQRLLLPLVLPRPSQLLYSRHVCYANTFAAWTGGVYFSTP